MFITFIITLIIILSMYTYTMVLNHKNRTIRYDYKTEGIIVIKVIGHIFMNTGIILFMIASILSVFTNASYLWLIYSFGVVSSTLSLLIIIDQHLNYEAILDKKIVVSRIFSKRIIPIQDIYMKEHPLGVVFINKEDKKLFSMDMHTVGFNEFIHIIKELKQNYKIDVYENSMDDYLKIKKVDENLIRIGKEYRKNFNQNIKKHKIVHLLGIHLVTVLALLFFYSLGSLDGKTIVLIILGYFMFLLSYKKQMDNYKKDLELDDLSLGEKHRYSNRFVVGYSRQKQKILNVTLGVIIGCSLFMTLMVGLIIETDKPIGSEDLITISGNFLYYRKLEDELAIGFSNLDTEYRVSSINLPYVDQAFLDQLETGDEIILSIDQSDDRNFHTDFVSKTKWNYLYTLSYEDITYFSYEDYLMGYQANQSLGQLITYVSFGIAITSTVALIGAHMYYNHHKQYENIQIYV
ncbi:Uncharacterised protein [Acholeplasma oculi]|uniref:Uncharacterized protein n=1 Tax=Acholeplasma oculi TaxID=35623 RepID=A0A061AC50_9MOLU|nr:hypothetical protein [Acholeplasma oculi]CDR31450.1 hypothetical protein Aocu_13770 [Acholeplasma oculi]SKC40105.1 hypothetical protein SAMN02745122_0809 [Acholeplasma oculi]SUT92089.1 Uncharacterised protein [Acholeplasma oculi]